MKVRGLIAKKIKKIIGGRAREANESGHESRIVYIYMHENANLTIVLDDRVSHTHTPQKATHSYYDVFTNLKEFLASEAVDSICYAAAPPYLLQTPAQPSIILSR